MRVLTINGAIADIDEKTAIGIDFEAFDIANPGKRRVNSSNSFTIPSTDGNLAKLGNPQDPQSTSDIMYDEVLVSFWADGQQLLNKARGRVTQISDRITMLVFEKDTFWTTITETTFSDILSGLSAWLYTNYGISNEDHKLSYINATGALESFIGDYLDLETPSNGICMPGAVSNLHDLYSSDGFSLERGYIYWLSYYDADATETYTGAHLFIYTRALFEYLEEVFNVDFHMNDTTLTGNVWSYANCVNSFMFLPSMIVKMSYDSVLRYKIWFEIDETVELTPNGVPELGAKTIEEFLKAFLQTFNVILDTYYDENGKLHFEMQRFEELADSDTPIVDWSGKLDGKTAPVFKPVIKNYAQTNYIDYAAVYSETNEHAGAHVITSSNKNLDSTANIFSINSYYPPNYDSDFSTQPLEQLTGQEALGYFMFFLSTGVTTSSSTLIRHYTGSTTEYQLTYNVSLNVCQFYAIANEYNLLGEIVDKPRTYEAKMWLTPKDLSDLKFYKLYYIKELRGAYFLTKIEGYNPSLSKEATKVYLLKVSDRTPAGLTK